MNVLQTVIDSHSSLRSDRKGTITRIWDPYQVDSGHLDALSRRIGILCLYYPHLPHELLSSQGPATGRIETKLDKIHAQMLRDDMVQAGQSTVSLASTVSVL